jgi:hypothetical protein
MVNQQFGKLVYSYRVGTFLKIGGSNLLQILKMSNS